MDIMHDIETLGKKPGCVVLSIGAVAFDPLGEISLPSAFSPDRIFYQNISIFEQIMAGLTIDMETVDWWKNQSDEAKHALTVDVVSPTVALTRYEQWVNSFGDGVRPMHWANSPRFDLAIIETLMQAFTFNPPWDFRQQQDCRAMKYITELVRKPPYNTPPPPRNGTHHNALDDCFHQIAMVQYYTNAIIEG